MTALDHPTLFQEISAMASSAVAGGAAFRYGRIFAQALPMPDNTTGKFYQFFYNLIQGLADNQHLLPQADSGKEGVQK